MRKLYFMGGLLLSSGFLYAQGNNPVVNFRYFGHLQMDAEYAHNHQTGSIDRIIYANLGEQDFFATAQITDRISFLGETVVRPDLRSSSSFIPSIERSQLKFDYFGNHSFLIGKFHTPVNYWNDIYHHGRLFFPVIDRPLSFSYLVPLHTTGIRFQAQNLGDLRFGYDAVLGNGISSTDIKDVDVNKSVTLAAHVRPVDRMRIGASYYYDLVKGNVSGVHSGHTSTTHSVIAGKYKGNIEFQLMSFSFAWFGERFEFLHEFCFNRNNSDSLGIADNGSAFIYAGYRVNKFIPFIVADYVDISDRDLHVNSLVMGRLAAGLRYEFSPYCNVKVLLERLAAEEWFSWQNHTHASQPRIYELKVQVAYGF